jgi:hypothetical protein
LVLCSHEVFFRTALAGASIAVRARGPKKGARGMERPPRANGTFENMRRKTVKKHYSRGFKVKVLALVLSISVVIVLVAIATGATGAYFSDTKAGAATGTIGSVKVITSGGTGIDGLDFNWANMLPGTVYSNTIHIQSTGTNSGEDLYMTFPNLTALSALNTLGKYGQVHISVNGTEIYANANLNDIPNNGTSGLPAQILLAQNVGPTASITVVFTFEYATLMSTQEPGGVFNQYPITTGGTDSRYTPAGGAPNGNGYQTYVNPTDGSGNGLPFQIVATQPGIAPGTVGSKF